MVNGTNLTMGPIIGSGTGEDDRIMGVETGVKNELVEIGGFAENE